MDNKIKIFLFHGRDKNLMEKISSFCEKIDDDYYFNGSVGEFAEKWQDKFICYKIETSWIIGVTYRKNFGTY